MFDILISVINKLTRAQNDLTAGPMSSPSDPVTACETQIGMVHIDFTVIVIITVCSFFLKKVVLASN